MKKKLIGSVVLIIVVLVAFLGYRGITRQVKLKAAEGNYQTIPSFAFYGLDSQKFVYNKDANTLPAVIVYFSPDCDHCQYEAGEFVANRDKFKEVNIYMISSAPADQIKMFANTYHLSQLAHITLLNDKDYKFTSYFGSIIFPSVLVYGADGNLKKKYKGEVKIDAILNQLK